MLDNVSKQRRLIMLIIKAGAEAYADGMMARGQPLDRLTWQPQERSLIAGAASTPVSGFPCPGGLLGRVRLMPPADT